MIRTALDRLALPPSAKLLGWHLLDARPKEGSIKVGFVGKAEFCDPAGFVQGGLLAASFASHSFPRSPRSPCRPMPCCNN
jgi:hypothetical protein